MMTQGYHTRHTSALTKSDRFPPVLFVFAFGHETSRVMVTLPPDPSSGALHAERCGAKQVPAKRSSGSTVARHRRGVHSRVGCAVGRGHPASTRVVK